MIYLYLSAVLLLAFIYPYLVYPLVLLLFPKRSYAPTPDTPPAETRVALLFCAYNEERALPAKIQNLREIKKHFPSLEVRVYTDCCTDASVEILRGAEDILTLHEGLSRAGKGAGMRVLVDATDADILIFTDAAAIIEPETIPRLISYFNDPLIGTAAGTLHYVLSDDNKTARSGSLYWRLEEFIKRLESETGSTMGAGGALFAMRRSLYPTIPIDLLDDMIASISPIFSGHRVVSVPDVYAFERATSDSADEFRRKRRIACRAFNTHRFLAPQLRTMGLLNRFKYVSHKYIRWFSAAFLLLWLLFTFIAIVSLAGIVAAAVTALAGVLLLVLGLRFNLPLIGTLVEIFMSILATGLGVLEALAGRSYQTWTPAKSRRD